MGNFWRAVEGCWNRNRIIAWGLVGGGGTLVFWAWRTTRSPGVSIGLLALVAGIMSVRPKMHMAEKFAWVSFLIIFAYLEIRAIDKNDADNLANRQAENKEFSGIVDRLDVQVKATGKGFQDTADAIGKSVKALGAIRDQSKRQFDQTLEETGTVQGIAAATLAATTSAGSIPCVTVSQAQNSPVVKFVVTNFGKNNLTAVHVRIKEFTGLDFKLQFEEAVDVLVPDEPHEFSEHWIAPFVLHKLGKAEFAIFIRSSNGAYREELELKPNPLGEHYGLLQQYTLYKFPPKSGMGIIDACKHTYADSPR